MRDLESKKMIVAKGLMFLTIAVLAVGLILAEVPSLRLAMLLGVLIWASCRFYYFTFYVLERYVDPALRYAGLSALVLAIVRRRQR